jgi:hypothetical protein
LPYSSRTWSQCTLKDSMVFSGMAIRIPLYVTDN